MRHVLTLIAPPDAPALHPLHPLVARLSAKLNPDRRRALSPYALDLELTQSLSASEGRDSVARAHDAGVDAVLQPLPTRRKRLLISDMDSTLIAQECIDELAERVGFKPQIAAITARAMQGELEFKAALAERVGYLRGLSLRTLDSVYREQITLMPGAPILMATLQTQGVSTHLVSGGFTYFTARIAKRLGMHSHDANRLELADGRLTGRVLPPILDRNSKVASLLHYARRQRVALPLTLAVGDGANDLPMLLEAGLGVAFHAKPTVAAAAPAQIRFNDLSALLYVLGIPPAQWVTPAL